MMGGREIILLSLFNSILQIPFTIFLVKLFSHYTIPKTVIVTDIVLTIIMLFALAFNGVIRIFATSKHLRVLHRIIIFLFMWIPVINFYIAFKYCKIIKNEYGIELYREELHATREESQVCKTKYPLLLLHGIGFRDPKYASYWGRIPKWLKRNGAVIYYGEQHAWGTMENNAEEIKNKIRTIMEETGSEKINIIAHSKGGLDARYLISSLEMAKHVASLTTISTPHRGSELIDVLEKLGEKKYRQVTASIDKYFKFFGDSVPDSYTSSKQLKPSYMEKFNEENPDSPLVYYQSYGDAMSQANSDGLLSGPYLLMKWAKGESDGNDGLVSLESAKWGEFRGLFSSEDGKGLSHGDVIDLKRKDMDGSDVIEKYIEIVSELKEKGY
ncbi:MAG: triacylglycerol lipase [bacterium]|nr:triacylglycerol lipase [bacterium]